MIKTHYYLSCIFFFLCLILSSSFTNCLSSKPRVSIITSVFKGDEFIEGFLKDITSQTIFADCELILINANSPGNEEPIILPFLERYPNIRYEKLEKDPGVYGVWNLGIKKARSDYITNANIDDRRNPDCLERHANELDQNPEIDLVYSDFLLTRTANSAWGENVLWRVETPEFTPERIHQCFEGPQPMWRKSLHDKCGLFSEDFFTSGDLEMWHRAISQGCLFKHVDGTSGLYFDNPQGLSTKVDSQREQEDLFVNRAYGYFRKGLDASKPQILIKIPSDTTPENLFRSLNLYYRHLSGEVSYRFVVSIKENNLNLNTEQVKEKLSTYPNLSFYISQSSSIGDLINTGIDKKMIFDWLLIGSDQLKSVEHGFDKSIVDKASALFPKKDGVLQIENQPGSSPSFSYVIGKYYYVLESELVNPNYQTAVRNQELILKAKMQRKACDRKDLQLFYINDSSPKDSIEDLQLFHDRQQRFFDFDVAAIEKKAPKLWSILICTLDERKVFFDHIYPKLNNQIKKLGLEDEVEVLYFCDNREHSVGYKRNKLLEDSSGKYICFIDDDDDVHDNYIEMLVSKMRNNPDCLKLIGVITFNGSDPRTFIHSIAYDTYFEKDQIYYRPPNHLNPVKRIIGIQFDFPEINSGEDTAWAMKMARSGMLKTEESIDVPYYFYLFIPNKR